MEVFWTLLFNFCLVSSIVHAWEVHVELDIERSLGHLLFFFFFFQSLALIRHADFKNDEFVKFD